MPREDEAEAIKLLERRSRGLRGAKALIGKSVPRERRELLESALDEAAAILADVARVAKDPREVAH